MQSGRKDHTTLLTHRAAVIRLRGLIRKEFLQIWRDPSSIAIAFLLPVILLLIFGYGVSLDPRNIRVIIVAEQPDGVTTSIAAAFEHNQYFHPQEMSSIQQATQKIVYHQADAIIHLQNNFTSKLDSGQKAHAQLIVNGVDSNYARAITGYVSAVFATWAKQQGYANALDVTPPVTLDQRIWYNPELKSRYFLVPGLIAVIMTLIGALLTALVMAREWERGTMESLMVTPVGTREILIGKLVPYYILGMGGMLLSVAMAIWLFHVPLRGSFWVLMLTSSMYLQVALGMGLLISAQTRDQFLASQAAILATYLPALMLSGFIFEISSAPWVIQQFTRLVPARYFVSILQTVFLAGNIWPIILTNTLWLTIMATVLLTITRRRSYKRLD